MGVYTAVDAEIFEPDVLLNGKQRLVMPLIENQRRIVQKRGFLVLHPRLIGHVGVDVVHFPIIANRQMIGQYLAVDEDEAIFPKETVGRAIVGIFDKIAVGLGGLRQIGCEFFCSVDLVEIIPAMGSDRPGQSRCSVRQHRPQVFDRKTGAGLLAPYLWYPTAIYPRQ